MSYPAINNQKRYGDPRRQGEYGQTTASITDAVKSTRSAARRGRRSGPYDAWTVVELKKQAKELGLTGYSSLNKEDLIDHLRSC